MNPVPTISVINQSSFISDAALQKIVLAIGMQLAEDVAPEYGTTPALEFVPKGQNPSPDSAPCYVMDTLDVQGALGYHDTDDNGNPYIKIGCQPIYDNGGTDYTGSNSVSVTLSHEVLELVGDTDANLWADGPDGADYAFELCDAVESDSYEKTLDDGTKISVSNFVYKAFFNAKLKANSGLKLDQMGKLPAPFQMSSGGYQIRRTEPGNTTQIFGQTRGAVQIEAGVTLVFGETFPAWKRPYKMRKAMHRAKLKPHRFAKVYTATGQKPPPYDSTRDPQPKIASTMPVKTFAAPATRPHKPPMNAPQPKPEKKEALPAWLEKIRVDKRPRTTVTEAPTVRELPEADSLAAGSGSHKYSEPGTTDWLDRGYPDHENEGDRAVAIAPKLPAKPNPALPQPKAAKPELPLPEWLKKLQPAAKEGE